MLTRFDHAVIAARDLEDALRCFTTLGFAVSRGGRHPGHGTENALIRFGLDYLELLAVADPGAAQANGLNGRDLLTFLEAHPGGWLGYALASDDFDHDAAQLRASGMPLEGPFAMRRERPDGSVLAWRLAIPGGTPWRRPWPFLIQWDRSDADRLALERPTTQPNGTRGVAGVTVAVRNLDTAIALYQHGLGLPLLDRHSQPALHAEVARFAVGGMPIELLAPLGDGPLARTLTANGEGLMTVRLRSADLEATRRAPGGSGASLSQSPDGRDELVLPPEAALGARLIVTSLER
jgi:catechol 2,3-dioxygenase-like lactoylglutathione lyase family enzyme